MHSSRMRTVSSATHTPLPHISPPCTPPCHARPPLWTEFLTRACENITFLQLLLRTVKLVNKNKCCPLFLFFEISHYQSPFPDGEKSPLFINRKSLNNRKYEKSLLSMQICQKCEPFRRQISTGYFTHFQCNEE